MTGQRMPTVMFLFVLMRHVTKVLVLSLHIPSTELSLKRLVNSGELIVTLRANTILTTIRSGKRIPLDNEGFQSNHFQH